MKKYALSLLVLYLLIAMGGASGAPNSANEQKMPEAMNVVSIEMKAGEQWNIFEEINENIEITFDPNYFEVTSSKENQTGKMNLLKAIKSGDTTVKINTSDGTVEMYNVHISTEDQGAVNGKSKIIIRFAKWGWSCISGVSTLNWVWDQAPGWLKDMVRNTINTAYNNYKSRQEYMQSHGFPAWDPLDFCIVI